mmetsp:Transcript_15781/g.23431  ORF Transcript_15781/g.23431 Transcript_15781/m.23431 type:complete len:648 (-) Transcript_15781:297-2240(-)
MLTKDQLLKLMMSKEFGPCVPSHLYKVRPAASPPLLASRAVAPSFVPLSTKSQESKRVSSHVVDSPVAPSRGLSMLPNNMGSTDSAVGAGVGNTYHAPSDNILQYQHNLFTPENMLCEEHPAAAMHRLKLISSWFDSMATVIQTLNTEYNNVQTGQQTTDARTDHQQQQSQQKEQFFVDEINRLMKTTHLGNSVSWPWMSYNHIRKGVADVFNQWLFQAHAIGNTDGLDGRQLRSSGNQSSSNDPFSNDSYDEDGWIRQGRNTSSRRRMGDDPVLLSHVPHAMEHVKSLLMSNKGSSSLCVPMEEIADLLANDFLLEMDRIASEVQKTQLSHVRNGGEEYHRSVEDAVLGMRLSEEASSYYNDSTDNPENAVMIKIEWVTKASILNVRTPPFQKVYKPHFDLLRRNYCDTSSKTDPDLKHVLTRIFVLLCRYDTISALKGVNHAAIPPRAFEAMSRNFGISHECFASPLNRVSPSYNSIFPDVDRFFGSLGSFFDFLPLEGSFEANPPFDGESTSIMFEHIFGLLQRTDTEKNALSFLVVVPKTNDALSCVNGSPFLRKMAVIDTESSENYIHKGASSIKKVMHDNTTTYHFKQPMTINGNKLGDSWSRSTTMLLWLQNDHGHTMWTPTEEKVESVVYGFLAPPAFE